MMTIFTIGQVAKATDMSAVTIRRYEKRGWLHPRRDWRGHRLFTQDAVDFLRRVKQGDVDPNRPEEAHPPRGGGK